MQKERKLSRRGFIKASGMAATALTLSEFLHLNGKWRELSTELMNDWQEAHSYSSPEDFRDKNKEWLKSVNLAGNLSVEDMDWIFRPDRPDLYPGAEKPSIYDTLKIIKEDLGINTLRFAIRLSDSIENIPPFQVKLDKYEPWLVELAKRDFKTILNVGAKTMRWPETHVTFELMRDLYDHEIPPDGHVFSPTEPLGEYVLKKYYPELFSALKALAMRRVFPSNFFSTIQPENEADNKFGEHRWAFNRAYSQETIRITHHYFPEATILQNAPPHKFRGVGNLLTEALSRDPSLDGKLLAAFNFYYRVPHPKGFFDIEVDGEEVFDNLVTAQLASQITGDIHQERISLERKGIQSIVTEMQAEPWDPYTQPGNSFPEFIFALLRCKRLLGITSEASKADIMIWGLEKLIYNLENPSDPNQQDHQQIVQLINLINSL